MAIFWLAFIWSGLQPKDQFTWFLEVLPAALGFAALVISRRSFPLTPLTYGLILIHCLILMIGGHYTYAEVPFFDQIGHFFGSVGNNYDKLGHFAQGFVPAIIAREIVIRNRVITGRGLWQGFFVVCFCLAFSAFYELIEWWVALASGEDAEAFLGTQGYIWDTQSDMAMALLGAIGSYLLLKPWHDRQLARLSSAKEHQLG